MNNETADPAVNVIPLEPIKNIPYVSGYDEYIFDTGKTNNQTNNLYSAIMAVTKASHHLRETYKKTFEILKKWTPKTQKYILHFIFLQPLIIFSGKIFVAKFKDSSGELEFESAKFVQIARGYVSKDYDETGGEIHIVSFDALEEYLSLVDAHYRYKENIIVKNQKTLLLALRQVMPNLKT